ncbi:MAG: class I SAM-dependent methyltransferase [Kiritimatiellae bacterium]|nr:class I SAM-dependent methyltransferase [Kiritimatiellia bacterium]
MKDRFRRLRREIGFLRPRWREGWWRTYAVAGLYPLLRPVAREAWLDRHRAVFAVRHHSLVNYPRLHSLYRLAGEILSGPAGGGAAECGVWRGGSAALFGAQARRFRTAARFWLFDSFQGLPEPREMDETWTGKTLKKGDLTGSRELAEDLLFRKFGLDPARFEIVPGWFADTIPPAAPRVGPLAILHIDCDYYDPAKLCLEQLYPKVSPGGAVIIDDYHYFKGAKMATDEFRRAHAIQTPLVPTDRFGVWFQKE